MTNMELIQLFGEARAEYVLEAQQLRSGARKNARSDGRMHSTARKFWMLVAAVITLLALSVTAYAAINARIKMQMVDHHVDPTETVAAFVEGQPPKTVEEILTTYYPQSIPEGYQCISGMSESSRLRNLIYENEDGKRIIYAISATLDFSDVKLKPPVETNSVTVAGQSATLTTSLEGAQCLIWANLEVGYHVCMTTEAPEVDLVAMADSVSEGEPLELNFYIGDNGEIWEPWYPQQLPEGYECMDVSNGTDGVQIVRYVKEGEGSVQYVVATEDDLSDIGTAPHSTMVWEDVDIDGTPARMVTIGGEQRILFWKNEAEGFNARLDTTTPGVDLVEIAKSVGPGPRLEPTPRQGPGYTVTLEKGDGGYVDYEPMYPQWVPEGYQEIFVGDKAYGRQDIRYENADGKEIRYEFWFRLSKWGWKYGSEEEPEQVDINGHVGYKTDNSVVWTDEERGFGFYLVASPGVDLLKMARSVAVGPELVPTNAGQTEAALEELGDYQITALPEGMSEDGLAGWPLEDEGDWYSYVRRWYFNRATNADLYFTYETYVTDHADSAKAVSRMQLGGDDMPLQEVTICGCDGYMLQSEDRASVAWAVGDGARGMVFHMTSETFTAEEVVELAQSVEKVN